MKQTDLWRDRVAKAARCRKKAIICDYAGPVYVCGEIDLYKSLQQLLPFITLSNPTRNRSWIAYFSVGVVLVLMGLTWLSSYLRSGSFVTIMNSLRIVHEGAEAVVLIAMAFSFGTLLLVLARRLFCRIDEERKERSTDAKHL
jgi:hypothetical protein